MRNRQIRQLVTNLSVRLFDKSFLKRIGLRRREMQELFERNKWEEILGQMFPVQARFSCREILEVCRAEMNELCGEPQEGWMSFAYQYATHILYSDPAFMKKSAPYAAGAVFYLHILQFFLDEERIWMPFDPFFDFELLTEEEYVRCERGQEYAQFIREFRNQYLYEMMRLNREVTPFETLGHIAGVHYVAMTAARGLYHAGVPIDLALMSGAAVGHDLGKFGCKTDECVPYLHYYYTAQWFDAFHMENIGHIAANHSAWDLELDNLSVENLVLIYADFRVKQAWDPQGYELTKIYSLRESYDVILSKLDNVDEAKRNRYRVVYARLREFERYMRAHGVDVELNGLTPEPEIPKNIVLQTKEEINQSFLFWGIEHNIEVMHRLGTDQQFGNILEAARSEKDWKNVRAYLNMLQEYSIHLNQKQKRQTLSFLYELLLNKESDIRRQAATLMGKIFADFNAGYRKELPRGMADPDEKALLELWEEYLERLICPDYRLTIQQKRRIRLSVKDLLLSAMERGEEGLRQKFFDRFIRWFSKALAPGEEVPFYLLDSISVIPMDLWVREDRFELLVPYAMKHADDSNAETRVAAIRALRMFTDVVPLEHLCGRWIDQEAEQRERFDEAEVLSDIFLENLKTTTPWIIKSVNIKLLADQAEHGGSEHLLPICSHFSNLLKVSEEAGVRRDAGCALLRLASLLSADQKNEIAMELLKGLEVGENESSKYIPEYLGEFALWLPPEQLDDLLMRLQALFSHGNEQVIAVALDTVGVLLECYSRYPKRFEESRKNAENRKMKLLGLILRCLANDREQVRQEAMLVLGQHLFGSERMTEQDKNELFSPCAKKLLFLLNENKGGDLSLYYRAALSSHIYRLISQVQMSGKHVGIRECAKIAFFPGTFDPFTLSHKEIARKIRELGFTVYLAVDEFSWSKKTQPHRIRRQIASMSVADEFYVHLFPEDMPINLASSNDIRRLKDTFPGMEIYLVVGSDVINNSSAYKKEPCEDSIHSMNHIVFHRTGEAKLEKLYERIAGEVIELELPETLEDISSTRIRENIDQNRDISNLIDPVAQEYIYHNGLYLREPEFKPIVRAKAIAFANESGDNEWILKELSHTIFAKNPDGAAILARIQKQEEGLIILQNSAEDKKPVGFVSYRRLCREELLWGLHSIELADFVRRKAGCDILMITGIFTKENESYEGEAIRDCAQLLLAETITQALAKNYSYCVYMAERGITSKDVIFALERQGFMKPEISENLEKSTVYCVDMHEPLMLLHNLETTIKEPFASSPEVLRQIEKNHKKLQVTMTKLYPGNLVLSLSSGIMHHRLVDRITALNDVPKEPMIPKVLGKNMCVPFGKLLRGKVVPNTVTKTLHTDKVYAPDLNSYTIEPFPFYSPLESQIRMIKSFERPVILVDDLVHEGGRLQTLVPRFCEEGIQIQKVVVGVISGYGRDLMQSLHLPVEAIYSMPNMKQWFVESTLYPFIGGDSVRRKEFGVSGLQPSINMILPYATPKLSGCRREALYEFSECCIENSRDLFLVLESEYRKQFARNLTLSRLSEAVILPLVPDKGSCMAYHEKLAASVYLENDLEMLGRMKKSMI